MHLDPHSNQRRVRNKGETDRVKILSYRISFINDL